MADFEGENNFLVRAIEDLRIATGRSFSLKEEQHIAVKDLLAGKDVLAVLPTGFGKSLIYQTFVRARDYELAGKASILVISPLNSIIRDQLDDMERQGYSAIDTSVTCLEDIRQCSFKIAFASAELVRKQSFRDTLKDPCSPLHQNIVAIVVDESHTVETWTGKRKHKTKNSHAFRDAFGELAVLRSLCKQGVPILALTGTADKLTQENICKQLCLKPDCTILFISPNKVNLRFSVTKVKREEMGVQLDWLVKEAKQRGEHLSKTIIFCNTLKDIASVVNLLLLKLGEHAYIPVGSNNRKDFIVGIFHSVSWPTYKERLLDDFKSQTSKKRIIVASSALSMGVNFPDIWYVINWGPAKTILDQLQEAGRGGRDGELSHSIIVYHGHQLSHCEDEVKDFVKTTGCYRVAVYKSFDPSIVPIQPEHNCCLNCAQDCNCDECSDDPAASNKYPFEVKLHVHECKPPLLRPVSDNDKEDLQAALTELSLEHEYRLSAFGSVSSHYFSPELVDDIVNNCYKLFTIQDIVESNLPVYSIAHSLKILEIIQEIFEDIPNLDCALEFFSNSVNCDYEYVNTENKNSEGECYFIDYFDSPDDNNDK